MKLDLKKVGHTIQIAGAIYTGEGKTWLLPLPGETLPGITDKDEMTLEEWQAFLRQADVLEVEVDARDPETNKIVKAILRKTTRQIDQAVSWRVYRRDGYKCRYCGRADVPLTVDHLVTWEEGGPSIEANLVAACKPCNKLRGRRRYDTWLASSDYKLASVGLSMFDQQKNEAMVRELEKISRTPHSLKKSRR